MAHRISLLVIIAIVFGIVSFANPATAGMSRKGDNKVATKTAPAVLDVDGNADKWVGRWYSATGATLTIHNVGAFVEIYGTDSFSNFQLHCLPDLKLTSRLLICVGHGRQLSGTLFTYQSRLNMGDAGDLTENWTARAWDESKGEVTKISSEEKFSKTRRAPAPRPLIR